MQAAIPKVGKLYKCVHATTVILLLCTSIPSVESLTTADFFPYGSNHNDIRLHTTDDGSSPVINIAVNFPFFGNSYNKVFVNANGHITFNSPKSEYTPQDFTLSENIEPMVAVYWADVDLNHGGDIWYRESTDQDILDKATQEIRASVSADWTLIVTWENVAFHPGHLVERHNRNTFQLVLVLDRNSSFVMFNYAQLEWTTGDSDGGDASGLGGTEAMAGFDAGDGVNYEKVPGSMTPEVLQLTQTSNVRVPGRWIYRLSSSTFSTGTVLSQFSRVYSPFNTKS